MGRGVGVGDADGDGLGLGDGLGELVGLAVGNAFVFDKTSGLAAVRTSERMIVPLSPFLSPCGARVTRLSLPLCSAKLMSRLRVSPSLRWSSTNCLPLTTTSSLRSPGVAL